MLCVSVEAIQSNRRLNWFQCHIVIVIRLMETAKVNTSRSLKTCLLSDS